MSICPHCGSSIPLSGGCESPCANARPTTPIGSFDALLIEARPTPMIGFESKFSTTRAPENDGFVIDINSIDDIDLSDVVCHICGTDYEPISKFCAECGSPRGGEKRATTLPYVSTQKRGSISSAPVPKFDPLPRRARLPVSSSYSLIHKNSTRPAPPSSGHKKKPKASQGPKGKKS